jgi:hypothetical protein
MSAVENHSKRVLFAVLGGAAVVAGCSHSSGSPHHEAQPDPGTVSIGRPVASRPFGEQRGGTLEMEAPAVGKPRSPGFRLAVLRAPGADARDLCVATAAVGVGRGEASSACDARVPGRAAVFAMAPGVPDRLGPEPTVVAGIAPPDIARVAVSGPGGHWELPLSTRRAFLVLYAHGVRGSVRVTAYRRGGGSSTRTFSLPLSRRPSHPHRRRGAVFDDEVGESILRRSYASLVRHFGPPADLEREHGSRCAYYQVVGQGAIGWRFCFADTGRMLSAGGNQRLPR